MPALAWLVLAAAGALAQEPRASSAWTFAVSGDSRNCGDVVMPAIAKKALERTAAFYWHLGDLRAIYKADEDMLRRRDSKLSRFSLKAFHDAVLSTGTVPLELLKQQVDAYVRSVQ